MQATDNIPCMLILGKQSENLVSNGEGYFFALDNNSQMKHCL
jgi:hypothetical protein